MKSAGVVMTCLALVATSHAACAHEQVPIEIATAHAHGDPAPARPEARESAPSDGPRGLAIANDAVRARAVVADFLDALGRADADAALALVADPMARTLPRITPRTQAAATIVRGLVVGSRPITTEAMPRIGRVRTILEVLGTQTLPDGLLATDVIVEVEMLDSGVAPRIPAQSGVSTFVVRPGPPARIIGL